MLLKVVSDLCEATNIMATLIKDLVTELEHERNFSQENCLKEGNDPVIKSYKKRAEDVERMLDMIEHENKKTKY